MVIPENLIPLLDEMLYELSTEKLEVQLVPGNDPDKTKDGRFIRAAISKNPQWYSELCENYPCTRIKKRNDRKDGTKIKRKYIFEVLERMIRNKTSNSVYASDLLEIAKNRKEMYDDLSKYENIPWNDQF